MFMLFFFFPMARLDGSLTRFTHEDWTCSNLRRYANANTERQNAERLVAESIRLQDETGAQTKKTQNDVNRKFGKHRFVLYNLLCFRIGKVDLVNLVL